MSKTSKIFIIIFITLGVITLGYYLFFNKSAQVDRPAESLYKKFNPFGISENVNNPNDSTNTENLTENPTTQSNANSNLRQITSFAIAGGTFFESQRKIPTPEKEISVTTNRGETKVDPKKEIIIKVPDKYETIPAIRYVERATGHIFQMDLDNSAISKVSNTTIPSIYEAIFDSKAMSVIYRYISGDKTISSYLATLGGSNGEFLQEDIIDLNTSVDKTKLFYLIKTSNGVTGFIRNYIDGKNTQVFTHSFSEWLSQFVSDKKIYLTTKPSYAVLGQFYSLNVQNGTISKLFGGVAGLTTLANNDGSIVLFGTSQAEGPKLGLFNPSTRAMDQLDVYGLPEKCVWGKDNVNIYCAVPKKIVGTQYPDVWYQGLVSFNDYFIKINSATKSVSTIENSSDSSAVDATKLFMDKEEGTIFFTNKKDGTLWSLKI